MTVRPQRQERGATRVIAILTVVALVLSAVLIGYSVSRGTSQAFDQRVLLMLRAPGQPMTPIGPLWLTEVSRDITALGGVAVLTLLTTLATIHLLLRREWTTATLVAAAAISGTILSNVLKDIFARPRPELTAIADYGVGSFPSGHSTASAVVYLTLGLLLAHAAEQLTMKVFYVLTAIERRFPLLATRTFGKGRTVAWTSDIAPHWLSQAFASWDGYNRLMRNMIDWVTGAI